MFHIVLFFIAALLLVLAWHLVHSAPRVLSMLLPQRFTFIFGACFFTAMIFAAFAAAYGLRDPSGMLHAFIQGIVGLFFMLAASAGLRGSYDDEQMLRRLFLMVGLVMGVIIAALYVHDPQLMALINLVLVTSGFWVMANFFRFLDRGR